MGWPAQSVLSLVLQAHSIPRGRAYNMIQDQECKANGDLGSWDGYVRGKWYLARVPEGEAGWMEKKNRKKEWLRERPRAKLGIQ